MRQEFAVRLVTAAMVLLLAAACARREEPAEPVATTTVRMPPSYVFRPAHIRIAAGDTVTWVNDDHFTHSVRLRTPRDTVLVAAPGDSLRFAFPAPGVYPYDCSFHPQMMSGAVEVTEP